MIMPHLVSTDKAGQDSISIKPSLFEMLRFLKLDKSLCATYIPAALKNQGLKKEICLSP